MPEFDRETLYIIKLYSRCLRYSVLPYYGGIMDQPAWIMELFDVITGKKESYEKEQSERIEQEARVKKK
jgi:hypothetical protein